MASYLTSLRLCLPPCKTGVNVESWCEGRGGMPVKPLQQCLHTLNPSPTDGQYPGLIHRLTCLQLGVLLTVSESPLAPLQPPVTFPCTFSWSVPSALRRLWRWRLGTDFPCQRAAVPGPCAQHLPPGSCLAGPGVPPDIGCSHLPSGNPQGRTCHCSAQWEQGWTSSCFKGKGRNSSLSLPQTKMHFKATWLKHEVNNLGNFPLLGWDAAWGHFQLWDSVIFWVIRNLSNEKFDGRPSPALYGILTLLAWTNKFHCRKPLAHTHQTGDREQEASYLQVSRLSSCLQVTPWDSLLSEGLLRLSLEPDKPRLGGQRANWVLRTWCECEPRKDPAGQGGSVGWERVAAERSRWGRWKGLVQERKGRPPLITPTIM